MSQCYKSISVHSSLKTSGLRLPGQRSGSGVTFTLVGLPTAGITRGLEPEVNREQRNDHTQKLGNRIRVGPRSSDTNS